MCAFADAVAVCVFQRHVYSRDGRRGAPPVGHDRSQRPGAARSEEPTLAQVGVLASVICHESPHSQWELSTRFCVIFVGKIDVTMR